MASELVEGKRTFIIRVGRQPYALPEQHTAQLSDYRGARTIDLASPDAAGKFYVEGIDEDDERITVWVGDPIIQSGPTGSRNGAGYPFLD